MLCANAALIDDYAPAATLKKWLALVWQSACAEGERQQQPERQRQQPLAGDAVALADVDARDATGVSVVGASWRLLTSAQLYELPRVRQAMLPAAWRLLQRRLPPLDEARGKRAREQLSSCVRSHATVRTRRPEMQEEEEGEEGEEGEEEGRRRRVVGRNGWRRWWRWWWRW